MRHTGVLGGRPWVTRCNHHVTVIPNTPLTLTTVRNITGHMVLGRVAKLSRDASVSAGLAAPAGRGRRHALTFHCFNALLKTSAKTPGGPIGVSWVRAGPLD